MNRKKGRRRKIGIISNIIINITRTIIFRNIIEAESSEVELLVRRVVSWRLQSPLKYSYVYTETYVYIEIFTIPKFICHKSSQDLLCGETAKEKNQRDERTKIHKPDIGGETKIQDQLEQEQNLTITVLLHKL